jgi:hypothetical protein
MQTKIPSILSLPARRRDRVGATRRALLLLGSLLLCACSHSQYHLGTPLSTLALPQSGPGTMVTDVMSILGPPQRLSADPAGYVFAWEYWRVVENGVGFNLGPLGADFISLDWARVDSHGEFVVATFSSDHQLTSITHSRWSSQVGDGRAMQPFGIYDVATTGDLLQPLPQHRWGGAMLRRLPEALNRDTDIDSGENGLEQRATPQDIGQRALEMR